MIKQITLPKKRGWGDLAAALLLLLLGIFAAAPEVRAQQPSPSPSTLTPASSAVSPSPAAPLTAFQAVRLLPPGQLARMALIEGRDGNPVPQRWYIVVYDPAGENGVHEYVVAENRIVASRGISQFVEHLTPDDIMAARALRQDSDHAFRLAAQYAAEHQVKVTQVDYRLHRDSSRGGPVWRLTLVGESGKPVAIVRVPSEAADVVVGQLITEGGDQSMAQANVAGGQTSPASTPARASAKSSSGSRAASRNKNKKIAVPTSASPPASPVPEKREPLFRRFQHLFGG